MTTRGVHADGAGGRGGRWGHHAPQVLIAAVAATVLLAVVPPAQAGPWGPLLPVLLIGVVLATWVQLRRHDRGLCEHCVRAMPVNPSLEAERFRRRLALAHLGGHPRLVVLYLVVLLGTDVGVAVAPAALLPAALVGWAGVQSTLVYLVLSHVTHRRLQPWCPGCRRGGDGPGERDPERDPVPSDHRGR